MKTFTWTFLIGLVFIGAFVYSVDPAGRWHRYPFQQTANWTAQECIISPKDFDEMVFKGKHFSLVDPPEIVVFGSSRMMLAGSKELGLKRVYNASMSGASIEDHVTFWQLIKTLNKIPKSVILQIDPWVFSEGAEPIRWMSNLPMFGAFEELSAPRGWPHVWLQVRLFYYRLVRLGNEFAELMSREMFRAAIQQALSGKSNHEMRVVALADKPAEDRGFRNDGSYLYPTLMVQPKSFLEMRKAGEEYATSKEVYGLRNWEFSPSRYHMVERFIQDMLAHDVRVTLVAPPYQTRAYEIMKQRDDLRDPLGAYEKSFERLATAYPINSCFKIDPVALGCSDTDFIDGMHMLPSCLAKLLDACRLTR